MCQFGAQSVSKLHSALCSFIVLFLSGKRAGNSLEDLGGFAFGANVVGSFACHDDDDVLYLVFCNASLFIVVF